MGKLEERNKAVIQRLFQAYAGEGDPAAITDSFAPRYRASRNGLFHLRSNAQGQGFPGPGKRLSAAFPDHEDRIEAIVAEGHQVMLQWEMTGTHRGNLFGIPPTGKEFKIWELALFNLADGKITEGWFMAEELAFLIQLGATLPVRKHGLPYMPEPAVARTAPEALLEGLRARPDPTPQEHNKISLLEKKIARLAASDVAAYEAARTSRPKTSGGSRHIHDYGKAQGYDNQAPQAGIRDRLDHIDDLIADGNSVFHRFTLSGTFSQAWYGLTPTNGFLGAIEASIQEFDDTGTNTVSRFFVDELGLALQLNALDKILGQVSSKEAG
jgi:predicted ester cyclase